VASISINRRLNLVLPVETDSGKIWVHSVPISREIFESNYMLLTKTLSTLYVNGIGPSFAPRVARLTLRDTAKEMDEENDISANLIQEIYRITNFLMPNKENIWQTIPFYEVKNKKLVDEQTLSEVENAIIYFIVASALHLRSELQMAYQGLKSSWNAQITSLNVTEYGNSLATLTHRDNTGEKTQEPVVQPITQKVMVPRISSVPS
jgi:hypothetical protein